MCIKMHRFVLKDSPKGGSVSLQDNLLKTKRSPFFLECDYSLKYGVVVLGMCVKMGQIISEDSPKDASVLLGR